MSLVVNYNTAKELPPSIIGVIHICKKTELTENQKRLFKDILNTKESIDDVLKLGNNERQKTFHNLFLRDMINLHRMDMLEMKKVGCLNLEYENFINKMKKCRYDGCEHIGIEFARKTLWGIINILLDYQRTRELFSSERFFISLENFECLKGTVLSDDVIKCIREAENVLKKSTNKGEEDDFQLN